ncbi:MAG: hypothetical protein EOP06_23840 [Proteobacteria bacterium]|nr:MAG: hypothetical protein EOP06_23840 [Pseudomonadota bacterium]
MIKRIFSLCAIMMFGYQAFANPMCSESRYKYYCDCTTLPNCAGQCWVPTYLKLDLTTGTETFVKYIERTSSGGSTTGTEVDCQNKLDRLPLCR